MPASSGGTRCRQSKRWNLARRGEFIEEESPESRSTVTREKKQHAERPLSITIASFV